MAQSPEKAYGLSADDDYLKNWDALGALIAQGRSFSGRERNCAFLNLGISGKIPSFACASGALNLDQIDDSRAIIPADWDGDGDLDLWFCNRSAPRLRFLRNDMTTETRWLSLKLQGTTCNRDAIGARAELTLVSSKGTKRTLWRRLRAGDAFLSQTPKTLHFGFGKDERIERLVMRWPAPRITEEVISVIEPNREYRIIEGRGAQELARGIPRIFAAGAASVPEEKEQSRIALVNRIPVPKLEYLDLKGEPRQIETVGRSQPTLILFWGSWCPICRGEMTELTKQSASLKNLRIIALAVDTASPDPDKEGIESSKRALTALQWPFDSGFATPDCVRTLALAESRALYPERPLPLPTSYLLSPDGRIAFIYHGPITAAQLSHDAELASRTPNDPEMAAFPFPGRSARRLFPLTLAAQAQSLREAGYLDDSRRELRKMLEQTTNNDAAGKASIWGRLADLEEEAGNMDDAVTAWKNALALTPDAPSLHLAYAATLWKAKRTTEAEAAFSKAATFEKDEITFQNQLGRVYQTLGRHEKAVHVFHALSIANPNNIDILFNLAVARQFNGDLAGAITCYEAVLQKKPDLLDAASNLAWILSTAKDQKLRNPAHALTIATRVNKAAGGRSPAVLDNLAASHAAGGDFPSAIKAAGEALKLAVATGDDSLAAEIRRHLFAYEKGRAWIDLPAFQK